MIRKRLFAVVMTAAMTVTAFSGILNAEELTSGDTTATTEAIDLSGYKFENVYGSQLYQYLDHQYTFEGKQVPLAESNFYFVNAFVELTQYYGMYYGTAEGFLDLSADYVDPTKYNTFGDFLVSYAERTLESSLIICSRAEDENLVLSNETLADIDDMVANMKTSAEAANLTLDGYLKLYYGEACDENAFRELLKHYYLADLYTARYCETHITDDMRQVPNIRYALFEAPESSAADSTKQTAQTLANELMTACAGDLDKLQELAEQSYADGFCKETNDIAVSRGLTVSAFEEWSFDPSRKEGDIGVIYAPEYGYFVVGYLGFTEQDNSTLESQAVGLLSDEITAAIEAGQYQFGTDQEYLPAVAVPTGADSSTPGIPVETSTVTPDGEKSSVASVLIIVFAVVGGVAVIAIIIILTAYVVKKINAGKKDGSEDKKADAFDDPIDEDTGVEEEEKKDEE